MERVYVLETKKIKKSSFYKSKKLFNIYDIDVNRMLVSKEVASGKKLLSHYYE